MLKIYHKPLIQSLAKEFNGFQGNIYLKREDLIHPKVSGNKWRKLKYNLQVAIESGYSRVLSFGGSFSNHLYAMAAAARELNLESIGIVRGEKHLPLNPTLKFIKDCGMSIHYMSRKLYRNKENAAVQNSLRQKFGNFYLIPEGGTNELAVRGVSEMIKDIDVDYDTILCPVGTGGTLAGVSRGCDTGRTVIGIAVVNAPGHLEERVNEFATKPNWRISHDYHFGGYAKFNNDLIKFINTFYNTFHIRLDPVYTGKMMYGLYDMIKRGSIPNKNSVMAIHTGGIQGIKGFNERFGNLIK